MVKMRDIDDLMGYLQDYAEKWDAIATGLNFQPDQAHSHIDHSSTTSERAALSMDPEGHYWPGPYHGRSISHSEQ